LIAKRVTRESADIASTSPLINESATMFHDARLGSVNSTGSAAGERNATPLMLVWRCWVEV
jgi:hypothetical protein